MHSNSNTYSVNKWSNVVSKRELPQEYKGMTMDFFMACNQQQPQPTKLHRMSINYILNKPKEGEEVKQ